MAAAADAALDIDDDLVALAFEQAFVPAEQRGIDLGGGGGAGLFGGGELFDEPGFGLGHLLELDGAVGLGFLEHLGGGGDLAFRGLDFLHELDLLIVEATDGGLAGFDLVAEGLVLLVFAGLPLLGGVLRDQLLFGFDLEFEFLPIAFELVPGVSGSFEFLFGGGLAGLDEASLGIDVGDLDAEADQASVAVLEDEELLDGFQHDGGKRGELWGAKLSA